HDDVAAEQPLVVVHRGNRPTVVRREQMRNARDAVRVEVVRERLEVHRRSIRRGRTCRTPPVARASRDCRPPILDLIQDLILDPILDLILDQIQDLPTDSRAASGYTPPMTHPISRFPVPAIDSLPDDVRERILKVQEKSGFVPNVFLLLARRPDEFRAFFAYHDALMDKPGGLSKAEREMIVVATSAANRCQYCVVAHGAILR